MSHRRTWGVVGLDGQQHLQVRLLAQCGDNIYVYEYDMTYLLIYWLLLVDAAAGTPNCRHGGRRDDLLRLHTSVLDSHLAQYLQHKAHKVGEKACDRATDLSPRDRQTIHDLPAYPDWQPTLDETSENTATAPGNMLTIQTSYLQACLPSLRPSPRPLHEDRRIYRGGEYNTGGHSEGGKVVPPGITTSDRGGSSQTRNGPLISSVARGAERHLRSLIQCSSPAP